MTTPTIDFSECMQGKRAPDVLSIDTPFAKVHDYEVYLDGRLQDMRALRYADAQAGVIISYEIDEAKSSGATLSYVMDYRRGKLNMNILQGIVEIRLKK